MPDNAPEVKVDPFDTKTNNDKAAAALLRDQSMAPVADPLSIQSLDDLAAAKSKENEEKAAAAAKEVDEVIPEVKPDVIPAVVPDAEAEKLAKEKADREAALKQAEDIFKGTPSLPPGASPKSSEAFSSVKIKAAQEISRLQAELDAAKKLADEAKASVGKPSAEQVAKEKELEELRQWRSKMDVDFDPKFKEFDKKVGAAHEFIYAQLRKNPVCTEETIEQIKKFGGPDKCNLSALFEAMKDPTLESIVKAQIGDVAKIRYEKEQAVTGAKANVADYLKERGTQIAEAIGGHQKATAAELQQFTGALDWLAEKSADAKADDAAKKEVEEHNKFVIETRAQMQAALQDDSPRMRATLITGVVQLFNLQRVHAKTVADLAAKSKALDEVTAKWEKVKASGRSRLPESSAAPGAPAPQPKKGVDVNTRSTDALDSIAKQIMEERARTGAAS
jgi:hypothetical protein